MSRRVFCRHCKKRRLPSRAVRYRDPYCTRTCLECDMGGYRKIHDRDGEMRLEVVRCWAHR